MNDLLTPLKAIITHKSLYGRFIHVVQSSYGFVGRFSLTNLSRWTFGSGGSLSTLERFFADDHDWNTYLMVILAPFLKLMLGDIILSVDQTTGKKSGKHTFGKSKNYDSKTQRVIPSISILAISLIHLKSKISFPVLIQQLVYDTYTKKKKKKSPAKKGKVGRPKGSKNKPKEIAYTFQVFSNLLEQWEKLVEKYCSFLQIKYIVGDNAFGNESVRKICQEANLELVSKLKSNAALFFPDQNDYKTKPKKYGDKLIKTDLLEKYRIEQEIYEGELVQEIYHIPNLWSKNIKVPLNVVIIKKYKDSQIGWSILFSTDMELSPQKIIELYQIRFQIEFDFRDARQHFGLTNFCNFKEKQVTNVIGNAFFMVTLSRIAYFKEWKEDHNTKFSILNLKARFRADKYLFEIKNMIENDPLLFFSLENSSKIAQIGAICL
jgi:putative transposase